MKNLEETYFSEIILARQGSQKEQEAFFKLALYQEIKDQANKELNINPQYN